MRPIFAAVVAILLSLFIMWLCLYTWSHVSLRVLDRSAVECVELSHCPDQWWTYPLMFALLLGPTFIFGGAGYLAATKQWSVWRVVIVFAALTAITVFFHSIGYVMPLLLM